MNKAELLAALGSKFAAVGTPQVHNTVQGIAYYTVPVYDVVGDTCRSLNVMFFVKNDGLAGEVAYWGGGEPKPAPPPVVPTFGDEAQVWLRSKLDVTVNSSIVRMFDQFSADNTQERARVRLTLEAVATGALSTVDVALWKVAGEFQYKLITA